MIRPLYKAVEPFMESPSGFGYRGVVMYDDKEDKVQCDECGKWFETLTSHMRIHKITIEDYKVKNGLNIKTPLCGTGFSKMRRVAVKDEFVHSKHSRPTPNKKSSKPRVPGTKTIMQQNKFGLCELQMKARYLVVKNICGQVPTQAQIKEYDGALMSAIERRHKTLNVFRKEVGDIQLTTSQRQTIPDIEIIACMRAKARVLGRRPNTRDFKKSDGKNPHYSTILDHFGSWRSALSCAGLK